MVVRDEWIRANTFGKILDIGCNAGHVFPPGTADNVTGLDIDQWKVPHYGGGFQQGDAANLPFPDQSFDCAVLAEILEHVPDPVKVLKEARRVAKVVVFTVPYEYNWAPEHNPLMKLDERLAKDGITHAEMAQRDTIAHGNCAEAADDETHPHLYHQRWLDSESLAQT